MKPAANVPGSVVPYVDSAGQKDSRLPAAGGLMWIATAKTPSYPQVARFSFVGTHFPNRNGDVVGAGWSPNAAGIWFEIGKEVMPVAIRLQTTICLKCANLVCNVFKPGRQRVAGNVEAFIPIVPHQFHALPPSKLEPNCSS